MALTKKFRIGILVAILAIVLVTLFAPVLVAKGVRVWFWWQTHGTNIQVTTESIEAPFLHPIVLRGFHLRTIRTAPVEIDVSATRVVFGLNLKSILLRTRGPTLQTLSVEGLRAEFRRIRPGTAFSDNGWSTIYRLLPQSFEFKPLDIRMEDAPSVVLLRGVSVTGSPVETGRFQAGEIVVSSPLFRQTFSTLKGATEWQGNRLTIAALTLNRGLDVQSLTADLSHLGKRRVGVDFDVDAFGGKLRGSVADEWRARRANWTIAGSANDISLSQTAEAFGFTDRLGGLLHAGKFTFRGDVAEALSGTASLWLELTAPAWRDREADLITLGLSLYGRQLELQQLYIKQKKNELTLNGESSFPTTAAGWLRPDFRGTVSASIEDLGGFASLFGANRSDFAGRMEMQGKLDARDRNFGGNLVANGSGLTMFRKPIDQFRAEIGLKRGEIDINQIEFRRSKDVLQGQGRIETAPPHNYSGTIDATIANIDNDLLMLSGAIEAPPISASIHADVTSSVWDANGVFDPPQSKPVTISATFPLRLGQPLDALWTAPVTATVDCADLRLAELPHGKDGMAFSNGSVSAQLTMTDTPRHPHLTGYLQLSAACFGPTSLDGRVRLDGNRGAIESLMLSTDQNAASFYGEINLEDTQQLRLKLFPNQPLVDLRPPLADCVSKLQVVSIPEPEFDNEISEIDLVRQTSAPNWSVSVRKLVYGGVSLLTNSPSVMETYSFCQDQPQAGAALQLGVQLPVAPSPTPTPSRPKRRKR